MRKILYLIRQKKHLNFVQIFKNSVSSKRKNGSHHQQKYIYSRIIKIITTDFKVQIFAYRRNSSNHSCAYNAYMKNCIIK